ncbi:MAG: hypothetical protein AAF456_15185 [Planctomycetota bacterium]
MDSNQLNFEQWQAEIQTFVADTNSQLLELRDQLAMHFANGRNEFPGEGEDSNDRRPALGPIAVNEKLSSLERMIASRLEQSGDGTE